MKMTKTSVKIPLVFEEIYELLAQTNFKKPAEDFLANNNIDNITLDYANGGEMLLEFEDGNALKILCAPATEADYLDRARQAHKALNTDQQAEFDCEIGLAYLKDMDEDFRNRFLREEGLIVDESNGTQRPIFKHKKRVK